LPYPATATVNAVLATIAPSWSFENEGRGRLVLSGTTRLLVRLRRADRLWLHRARRFSFWAGTTEQAICQLVLWWRDLPRRPLSWWRYCCSPQVGLGTAATLGLLSDTEPGGYADPARTGCVLCGAAAPNDWWALGKVIGPCCFAGKCRRSREATG